MFHSYPGDLGTSGGSWTGAQVRLGTETCMQDILDACECVILQIDLWLCFQGVIEIDLCECVSVCVLYTYFLWVPSLQARNTFNTL